MKFFLVLYFRLIVVRLLVLKHHHEDPGTVADWFLL